MKIIKEIYKQRFFVLFVLTLTQFISASSVGQKFTLAIFGDTQDEVTSNPHQINDLLIKKYPNIIMVLSGHVDSSAWHVEEGDHGNRIFEILQDYQGKRFDFGGGYLRLLTIDPKAGMISAKMYSPYYHKVLGEKSTFSFSNVKFITKFRTGEALNH